MAKMDLANNIAPILSIPPDTYTATVTPGVTANCDVVDTLGYEGVSFIIDTKTITGGSFIITVEESDDDFATSNPATGSDKIVGTIPGPLVPAGNAFDYKIYKVGYIGTKRYVRTKFTASGSMDSGTFSVIAVLGNPHSAPVATGFA